MPEIFGLNFGEKIENVAMLRESLNEEKKKVADELTYYKSIARDIGRAKKKVEAAERAYEKKESAKNASKLESANDELAATINVFQESEAQIRSLLDQVQGSYAEIADQYRGRKSDRVMDAFEKYSSAVLSKVIDIQANIDADTSFESNVEEEIPMAIPEIPVANSVPTPAAQPQQAAYGAPGYQQYPQYIPVPMPMPNYYMPQGEAAQPNIAPVSIDVSPMLEKALEATLDKFVAAFDKKIEDALADRSFSFPAGGHGASVGAGEIGNLESLIFDDEAALIEKLTSMIDNLKTLSAAMNELGTICADIAVKQATANEMQKQTNDMQRQTLREQKGVQVGQRVVNQDQTAISGEQAALQDQQKAMLENQKALVEGQQAMGETQRLVAENQAAIDEALKAAVAAQKEIISAQQAINAGNAKTLDVQNDVAEKQSATLALQKEALAAQRQLLRDQKASLEKQKGAVESK